MKPITCKCLNCIHSIDFGEAQSLPRFKTNEGMNRILGFAGIGCIKQSPSVPFFPPLETDIITGARLPDVKECDGFTQRPNIKKEKQDEIKTALAGNESTGG